MPEYQKPSHLIAVVDGEMPPLGMELESTIRLYRPRDLPPIVDPEFAQAWAKEVSDRIKSDDITLYEQRIGDLFDPDLCNPDTASKHIELLIRLTKAAGTDRQIITPDKFFPYIWNQSKVMQELDYCVIRKAIALMVARPGCTIAVNLSPLSLTPDLIACVWDNLTQAKLLNEKGKLEKKDERLELEITEEIEVNVLEVKSILSNLKQMGLKITLDDLGSKWSGLAYLHDLPVDGIKIDNRLIRGIAFNDRSIAIAAGLFTIASELSLSVVCEGVEEQFAAQNLRSIKERVVQRTGKDFELLGQGYYIQRPQPCC